MTAEALTEVGGLSSPKPSIRPRLPWYWIVAGILLVLIGLAVLWVLMRPRGPAYTTFTLQPQTLVETIDVSGVVEPERVLTLKAAISSRVLERSVRENQRVPAGTPLLRLDTDTLQLQLQQAQTQALNSDQQATSELRSATSALNELDARHRQNLLGLGNQVQKAEENLFFLERELTRLQRLHAEQAVTAQSVDQQQQQMALARIELSNARTSFETAQRTDPELVNARSRLTTARSNLTNASRQGQANIALARGNLRQAVLLAPFAGSVTAWSIQRGDFLTPGTSVARFQDLADLRLVLAVNELDFPKIRLNQPVEITFDAYPDKPCNGKVVWLSQASQTSADTSAASAQTTTSSAIQVFPIKIWFANPKLQIRPGMSADARISIGRSENTLAVPHAAVHKHQGTFSVRRLDPQGKPEVVSVSVGMSTLELVEIRSGLRAGDQVIIEQAMAEASPSPDA